MTPLMIIVIRGEGHLVPITRGNRLPPTACCRVYGGRRERGKRFGFSTQDVSPRGGHMIRGMSGARETLLACRQVGKLCRKGGVGGEEGRGDARWKNAVGTGARWCGKWRGRGVERGCDTSRGRHEWVGYPYNQEIVHN